MPAIEEIMRTAKEAGASDVHITVGIPPKMRVNGNLVTMNYSKMMPADTLSVLLEIMSESQRERFEERGEYDMSFSIPELGRYRVNAYKQRGSVALALRLVGTKVPSPESLGVPESVINLYERKRGLILVTGPTGSGKSTTLAAIIDKINNNRDAHVITLEDPIEYLHQTAVRQPLPPMRCVPRCVKIRTSFWLVRCVTLRRSALPSQRRKRDILFCQPCIQSALPAR